MQTISILTYIHGCIYMRRTKEDANETKAEIIEAAMSLFEKIGFEKTTMEAIAKKAEVTRGAIYWHFSNKGSVLKEIILQENAKMDSLIEDALSQNLSPFYILQKLVFSVIDHFYDDRRFRQYIKISWYKLSSDVFENLLKEKSAFVQNFLEIMENLLRHSKRRKEVDTALDIQQTALHLSCLINGFYRLYFVSPSRGRNKKQTVQMFQSFFASLEHKN